METVPLWAAFGVVIIIFDSSGRQKDSKIIQRGRTDLVTGSQNQRSPWFKEHDLKDRLNSTKVSCRP
jgi:hypothetical protein